MLLLYYWHISNEYNEFQKLSPQPQVQQVASNEYSVINKEALYTFKWVLLYTQVFAYDQSTYRYFRFVKSLSLTLQFSV